MVLGKSQYLLFYQSTGYCSNNFMIYSLFSDKIGRCESERFSIIYSTNKGYEKDIILPAKDSDDSDNNSWNCKNVLMVR